MRGLIADVTDLAASALHRTRKDRIVSRIAIAPSLLVSLLLALFVSPALAQDGPRRVGAQEQDQSVLRFGSTAHDFGTIWDHRGAVTTTFTFTNVSDRPVTITNVNGSCSCVGGRLSSAKTTFAPGEQGQIIATFNPDDRTGKNNPTVNVDLSVGSRVRLTLIANVRKRIVVTPPAANLGIIDFGIGATTLITLDGRTDGFRLTGYDLTGRDHITVRLLSQDGESIDDAGDPVTRSAIELTLAADTPPGDIVETLTLETTDPEQKYVKIAVRGKIMSDVRHTPTTVQLYRIDPGSDFSKEIKLHSKSGQPFTIEKVEFEGSTIENFRPVISASKSDNSAYEIQVSGRVPMGIEKFHGMFHIWLDVPGEGRVRIDKPYHAWVKEPEYEKVDNPPPGIPR